MIPSPLGICAAAIGSACADCPDNAANRHSKAVVAFPANKTYGRSFIATTAFRFQEVMG